MNEYYSFIKKTCKKMYQPYSVLFKELEEIIKVISVFLVIIYVFTKIIFPQRKNEYEIFVENNKLIIMDKYQNRYYEFPNNYIYNTYFGIKKNSNFNKFEDLEIFSEDKMMNSCYITMDDKIFVKKYFYIPQNETEKLFLEKYFQE
jgi:hypothetical protein